MGVARTDHTLMPGPKAQLRNLLAVDDLSTTQSSSADSTLAESGHSREQMATKLGTLLLKD